MNYMRNIIFGIYALVTFNASAMEYIDENGNRRRILYHQECSGGHRIHNGQIEYGFPQMEYFYADASYDFNLGIFPNISPQQYFERLQNNRQTPAQVQGLQIFPITPDTVIPLKIKQTPPPPIRPVTRK